MMIRPLPGGAKRASRIPHLEAFRDACGVRWFVFGRKGFQLEFEPFHRFFGKRIRQAINDVLDGAGRIEVREVASRPPPILNRPSIFGVSLAALAALAALGPLGPPRPSAGW